MNLVPRVLQATTVDNKNSVLVTGLYKYFEQKYGLVQARPARKTHHRKHGRHDRALKKVTALKNEARKKFRRAKKQGTVADEVSNLAKEFFKLVRKQSALKRKSDQANLSTTTEKQRKECHTSFWRFARKLLDDSSISDIHPSFTAEEASDYFHKVYASGPREFSRPDWMPSPPSPSVEFEQMPIQDSEIRAVIRKAKANSSPSPFDRVSYAIFKHCPSLLVALADLYNTCWSSSSVPRAWKTAAIKLIAKSSAKDDPSQPSNFRPIALTSCVGKIFTSILRTRWLDFMVSNGYLDSSLQKGFMPTTPGCIEHHCKLARILHEARSRHRSVAVAWLDLANAYGSVHHSLIQFSLQHYHAPANFTYIVEHLYSDLSATILSEDWCTSTIPLSIGVYQGDPLSVVIFNTVINTLVDTLKTQTELGYKIYNTAYFVNTLQYADDTCLVANSPAACQHLLNLTDKWLDWSMMRAKIPKCCAVSLQSSTGHTIDPRLTLSGQRLPFLGDNTIKFLGLPIQIPQDQSSSRAHVKNLLHKLLTLVDACSVTRKQKLKLYKLGICPRLNWPLTIFTFPSSWVERELEATATRFLKKWSGLAKSANPNMLYLPRSEGGLDLPSLSGLYKRLQVSRQAQLLTSLDPCVRRVAEDELRREEKSQRALFLPNVVVRDTMQEDPSRTRKALTKAVKARVVNEEATSRAAEVRNLPRQGHMFRSCEERAADVWTLALQQLPEGAWKFVLNAAHDTLPHNANLHLWGKKASPVCQLCKAEPQTLIHVLNACKTALDGRRYNVRHDAVLTEIYTTIKQNLPQGTSSIADLESDYTFPPHIVLTDLRPDIVWWNDTTKQVTLLELTIPFDTLLEDAARRKQAKYQDLVTRVHEAGYTVTLVTVEVGARGVPNTTAFSKLQSLLGFTNKATKDLMTRASEHAIRGSYRIWCMRNLTEQT